MILSVKYVTFPYYTDFNKGVNISLHDYLRYIYVEKNLSTGQLENQVDIIHTDFDTLNYFSNIVLSRLIFKFQKHVGKRCFAVPVIENTIYRPAIVRELIFLYVTQHA